MKAIHVALILALCIPLHAFGLTVDEGNVPVESEMGIHNVIVIVLDGSGSMDGIMEVGGGRVEKKMNVAKKALIDLIPSVPKDTQVGVIAFHGGGFNGKTEWIYPISTVDTEKLQKSILAVYEGGGTPLGEAIKLGADALLKAREVQHNYGSYQLLVVTDGQADDEEAMNTFASETTARQLRLDVIGVAMPGGETHRLATLAHSYQAAQNSVQLITALKQAVQVENTKGSSGVDDFSLLATIPPEVARDWLKGVTTGAPNHPLGEEPPQPDVGETVAVGGGTSPTSAHPPQPKRRGCSASNTSTSFFPTTLLALGMLGTIWIRRKAH